MKYTWKSEAIDSLKDLGGVAHVDDILKQIKKRGNIEVTKSKTPARTLANTLQSYSQSTTYGIDNIFYSVYGVNARKGIWGLVDYTLDKMGINYTTEDTSFIEGKETLRKHIFRERNQQLIKKAKQLFKEKHGGKLFCEVCGFNFSDVYGILGDDFIEAHHIKPVSEMKEGDETNINDIVMLCSNCHSMVHRKRPWLTKDDLKNILK